METFNPHKKYNGSFIPEPIAEIPQVKLSGDAKCVYGRMMRYAGKNGLCNPKRSTLAEATGLTVVTLDRKIKELVDFGLIEKTQKGMGRSNSYQFCLHEVLKGDGIVSSEVTTPLLRESIKESQLRENVVSEKQTLPPNFGSTRIKRVLKLYSRLWKQKYNLDYQVNFPRFGKAVNNFGEVSEMVIAALLLIHFEWAGMDGSDEFIRKRYFDATHPIEWAVTSKMTYLAYLKNVVKVDPDNEDAVYKFVGEQLAKIN